MALNPRRSRCLRSGDLARLLSTAEEFQIARTGTTLFVSGPVGCGNTDLLKTFAETLEANSWDISVIAGTVHTERFDPWLPPSAFDASALKLLEAGAALASTFLPLFGLLRTALASARTASEVVRAWYGDDRQSPLDAFAGLLRSMARERPVVCTLDAQEAEGAGWFWDNVDSLAEEIYNGLPVLMCVATVGPPTLGSHELDEADSLMVARRVVDRDLGDWFYLKPITSADLRRFVGHAHADATADVINITRGSADWTRHLWTSWVDHGLLTDNTADGAWGYAPGRKPEALAWAHDYVTFRLRAANPTLTTSDIALARDVLRCAALEGRRFTAAAVARSLQRPDDEVIDFIDDHLTSDSGPDDVIADAGSIVAVTSRGPRTLWRYAFETRVEWLSFAELLVTGPQTGARSKDLALVLEELYGDQSRLIAASLAGLYRRAGFSERAATYQRIVDHGVRIDVTMWRAQRILTLLDAVSSPSERYRLVAVLIEAADALVNATDTATGVRFAEAAQRAAPVVSQRGAALRLSALFHANSGSLPLARGEIDEALRIAAARNDAYEEALAWYVSAHIHLSSRRPEDGIADLKRSLALRPIWNRRGRLQVRQMLATVAGEVGDLEEARRNLLSVRDEWRNVGDRVAEASALNSLAVAELSGGSLDQAEEYAREAARLARDLRYVSGAINADRLLAVISGRRGDRLEAMTTLRQLLRIAEDLGEEVLARYIRRNLAELRASGGSAGSTSWTSGR